MLLRFTEYLPSTVQELFPFFSFCWGRELTGVGGLIIRRRSPAHRRSEVVELLSEVELHLLLAAFSLLRPRFDIDEDALENGVKLFVHAAFGLLKVEDGARG